MLRDIDHYFESNPEPVRSCLAALRLFLLHYDPLITETWRYKMPFYNFAGKRFCYLWTDKKRNQPYIGFVDGNKMNHPGLLLENRSRMKIFLIDPVNDLPAETMRDLISQAISLVS